MKRKWVPLLLAGLGAILLILRFVPFSSADVSASIDGAPYIMPAAYKVYANPTALNGRYFLFKMLLTNDSKRTLKNMKVSYRIPNFIDWTDLDKVPTLYPGQHDVVMCYPQFKDDIASKMTESEERAEIKITYNNGREDDETYGFKIMGRNQFVYTDIPAQEVSSVADLESNDPLICCMVTPEDPIVKYYTQLVQDKVMKGEEASVSNTPQDAVKFMENLYAATYLSNMVYSGDEGIPANLGDISSTIQSIRLPREVITGNTGLCIELSLLYASVLKVAGLHPIIFMIPGHAYPGVLVNGEYFAIEATGIGGQGLGGRMPPDSALAYGMRELGTFFQSVQAGDPRYVLIDVDHLEAEGVVPMELKDDQFLRQKVDEIAASWNLGGGTQNNQVPQRQTQPQPQPRIQPRPEGTSMASYGGSVHFNYPANWSRYDHPFANMPFLESYITPADKSSEIDVYSLPGISNPNQGLAYLSQQFSSRGARMSYQELSSNNGYYIFEGNTQFSSGYVHWKGVFRLEANGLVGITIGSFQYSQISGLINSILQSVN